MSQLKKAIVDKNLVLVKNLLKHVTRNDAKKTWTHYLTIDKSMINALCGNDVGTAADEVNILHIAAIYGYTSMVRAILDSKPQLLNTKTGKSRLTSLQIAILAGNMKTAKYLIEKKSTLKGALAAAAMYPTFNNSENISTDIARFLIERGANVNEKVGKNGETPIFFACHVDMLRFLVRKGANVNQRDAYGWTPFMVLAGDVHLHHSLLIDDSIDMLKELGRLGANIRLCGRNRQPREYEKKITALHALAHGLGIHTPVEMFNIYTYIVEEFRRKNISINPKTSLGNTPLLYLIKYLKQRVANNTASRTMLTDFPFIFDDVIAMFYDSMLPNDKNSNGKTVHEHLKSLSNAVNLPTNFVVKYIGNQNAQKINNIHIPNTLNRMDPISMNNVNINDAYIIKKDLHNQTIRNGNRNKRVKAVMTVYNKSSLAGMMATGRSLFSPITRRPFTARDIVKLSTVAPENEMKRYKNRRA